MQHDETLFLLVGYEGHAPGPELDAGVASRGLVVAGGGEGVEGLDDGQVEHPRHPLDDVLLDPEDQGDVVVGQGVDHPLAHHVLRQDHVGLERQQLRHARFDVPASANQSCAKLLVSKPLLILISKFSKNIDIESILVSKYPWKGY